MRITLVFLLVTSAIFAQVKPILPLPSFKQQQWQALEYYGFIHFNMNTFTNVEWGEGKEDPSLFNPTQLDCNQWARIAKKAGMKGLILTAKHHDGFALYPSKYTSHSVQKSPWKQGKGDVVRELANACKKEGIKFGIYLSPWDRFHPAYGTEAYNQVYANMQKELLTNYGPIFEFWYDGANGEGPNGKKQVYDWPLFHKMVNTYQPNAVQFSDNGPDIRWVGNEKGFAYETTWSGLNKNEIYPGYLKFDDYRNGQENGSHWVAPEVDVSIRPGWYYHPEQDNQVKTPDSLMKIYVASVGRNANLLVNIPVDTRGLIHPNDSASMMGFARLRQLGLVNLLSSRDYPKLLQDNNTRTFVLGEKPLFVKMNKSIRANALMLREPIHMGQRVRSFYIDLLDSKGKLTRISGKTIGNKRILTFPEQEVQSVKIHITDSRAMPLISEIACYRIISTHNVSLFH